MSNQAWDEQLSDLHRAQRRIRVAPAVRQLPPAKPAPKPNPALTREFAAGLAKLLVHERRRHEAQIAALEKRLAAYEAAVVASPLSAVRIDALEARMKRAEQTVNGLYFESVTRAAEQK